MSDKSSIHDVLPRLYEDSDVVVMLAPHEDELEVIVLNILKDAGRPLSVKEIHRYLEAVASEEKIRKTLHKLRLRKLVRPLKNGRYEYVQDGVGIPGKY